MKATATCEACKIRRPIIPRNPGNFRLGGIRCGRCGKQMAVTITA